MDAAARGLTELVTWLVKGGAKINQSDRQGRTALHHACVRARDGPSAAFQVWIIVIQNLTYLRKIMREKNQITC